MRSLRFRIATMLSIFVFFAADQAVAYQRAPRPERTEMSRALRRCGRTAIITTVVGGIIGAVADGGRGAARGAAIGAGVGALNCVILVANARRQDRILAAQREAARGPVGRLHVVNFEGADGKGGYRLETRSEQLAQPGQLRPVRYQLAGGSEQVSPDLGTTPPFCRRVSSQLVGDEGGTPVPPQIWCRTANGDYAPYAQAT